MTESSSKGPDYGDADDDGNDTVDVDLLSYKREKSERPADWISVEIQHRELGAHDQ